MDNVKHEHSRCCCDEKYRLVTGAVRPLGFWLCVERSAEIVAAATSTYFLKRNAVEFSVGATSRKLAQVRMERTSHSFS
jgi:hypothetical protein